MSAVPGSVRFLNVVGGSTLFTVSHGPSGPGGYELLAAGPTEMQRRRDVVTSPYIADETEVASVRGARKYGLTIHCVGATIDQAWTLRQALIDHCEQKTWVLGVTWGTTLETWDCRAADWQGGIDRGWLLNNRLEVTFSIPAKPHGTGTY